MKNYFTKALLTIATLGLFSCSDQLAEEVVQPSLNEDGIGYVAFSISTIGSETRGTRADDITTDFNQGTEYEVTRDAGANMVFFFNSDNEYLGKSDLTVLSDPKTGNDNGHLDETTFSARVNYDIASTVSSCIVLLNAHKTAFGDLASVEELSDFLKLTDDKLGRYDDYFTMSNSVYVDDTGKIIDVTQISSDNIKPTYEEASQNKVVVHVERLVAKFTAEFGENIAITNNVVTPTQKDGKENTILVRNSPDFGVGAKSSTWGIKIYGWDLNGTETETYFVKNLQYQTSTNGASTSINVYDESNKIGTNWEATYDGTDHFGWNDPSRLRSYWAVDPHYIGSSDRYPEQYRPGTNDMTTGTPSNEENALNYIQSYANLTTGKAFSSDRVEYAPENTFGGYTFLAKNETGTSGFSYQGKDYRRAATHIIVAAQLLLGNEINNPSTSDTEVADKYYYGGAYWMVKNSRDDNNNVATEDDLIKYMVKNVITVCGDLYTNEACTTPLDVDKADINIKNYFTLTSASGIKGADGRVMLNAVEGKLYQKSDAKVTLDQAIKEVGTAKHYKNGKMYYEIPIRHMAPKQDGTPHLYNIGSYGVVRNHWYKVTINSISKPGTPVDKPDQPIIPSDDPEDDASVMAFEIYIIPWHVVDWGVDL